MQDQNAQTETTVEQKIVTREDVVNYMSDNLKDIHDWNRRRQRLRHIYEGKESIDTILNFLDSQGLAVKLLGSDFGRRN